VKVLLTGGSGFLGSHVAEKLVEEGHEVIALVRKSSKTDHLKALPNVRFVNGAVSDVPSLVEAARGVDAVIHSAGLVKARSIDEFRDCNVRGTENLLEAVKKSAPNLKRFVHVSSQAATAPSPDGTPVKNDAEPRPVTSYGWSKLEAEQVVRAEAKNLPVTIVRPPMIYGPRDTETFQLFQSADNRVLPFIGDPDGKLSLIYAGDCAAMLTRALVADVPSGKAYFVTDGDVYSRRDLIAGLEDAVGKKALVSFPLPTGVVRTFAFFTEAYGRLADKAVMVTQQKVDEMICQWVADGSEAVRDLGHQPQVKWREGAARTARWYRDHGWL
jgi:nucleoside-diphosphate-sugar epimerase